MPIYEFTCTECQSKVEIFQQNPNFEPLRCGFRCPLPSHDSRGIRGFGTLKRSLSTFNGQMGTKLRDKPTVDEMQKAGFSVYENDGDGVIKKISGQGPEIIKTKQDPSED